MVAPVARRQKNPPGNDRGGCASISEPPSAARQSGAPEPRRAACAASPSDPAGGHPRGPPCRSTSVGSRCTSTSPNGTESTVTSGGAFGPAGACRPRPGPDIMTDEQAEVPDRAVRVALWRALRVPTRRPPPRKRGLMPGRHCRVCRHAALVPDVPGRVSSVGGNRPAGGMRSLVTTDRRRAVPRLRRHGGRDHHPRSSLPLLTSMPLGTAPRLRHPARAATVAVPQDRCIA